MSAEVGRQDRAKSRCCPEGSIVGRTIRGHAKLLLSLAITLAAAIALHRFSPSHWPSLAIDLMHSLHGPGFAALALIVHCLLQRQFPSHMNYLLAAAIAFGIGVLSEIAQIPGPRDAQLSDLIVDGLGIFGALGVLAIFDKTLYSRLSRCLRLSLASLSGVSLLVACVPFFWLNFALFQQYRALPEVMTFDHYWERAAFGQTANSRPTLKAAPPDWPVNGPFIAEAQESGQWGILISIKPNPDWHGYSRLTFVAASTGRPFQMGIALRDMKRGSEHQGIRYYKTMRVDSAPRQYVVSFDEIRSATTGRAFDFSLVESIVLSAHSPGAQAEVLLDEFRLER